MSVFYSKKIPLLPNGEYTRWSWNRKPVQWENWGGCPYCGAVQRFAVSHDSSLKIRGTTLRALVSCANPECGRQIRIKVESGKVKAYGTGAGDD